LGDRHTSHCPNQVCIVALNGLEVCDAAHSSFVMKKGQRCPPGSGEIGSAASNKSILRPVFLWCSSYVHRRNGAMFCTMNRAVHRRRPDQLRRIGDEVETVLIFSKRLAFLVFDAAIYYVGLWSLVKWLLR